jgi:hypothetical protein
MQPTSSNLRANKLGSSRAKWSTGRRLSLGHRRRLKSWRHASPRCNQLPSHRPLWSLLRTVRLKADGSSPHQQGASAQTLKVFVGPRRRLRLELPHSLAPTPTRTSSAPKFTSTPTVGRRRCHRRCHRTMQRRCGALPAALSVALPAGPS